MAVMFMVLRDVRLESARGHLYKNFLMDYNGYKGLFTTLDNTGFFVSSCKWVAI